MSSNSFMDFGFTKKGSSSRKKRANVNKKANTKCVRSYKEENEMVTGFIGKKNGDERCVR